MEDFKYTNHQTFCETTLSELEEPCQIIDFLPEKFKVLFDEKTEKESPIKISILDSGHVDHQDIKSSKFYVNLSGVKTVKDLIGHANMSAGIIASDGVIKGLNPQATIISAKVTESNSKLPIDNLYAGLLWGMIMESNIIVVNHTINEYTSTLGDILKKCREYNCVIICENTINLGGVINCINLDIGTKSVFTCHKNNTYAKCRLSDFKTSVVAALCAKHYSNNYSFDFEKVQKKIL